MWQWSIWEQEAAHKIQTDHPQNKELITFLGGSHWKQQQKFIILMKDSPLENEKQKLREFSRSLNPIQTSYDSQWNSWDLAHWKKKIMHPPVLLESSLSSTKIRKNSYSPHSTLSQILNSTLVWWGSHRTRAASLWTSWAAPNFTPALQSVFLWLLMAMLKKQLAWIQALSCRPLRWAQGFWYLLSPCRWKSTCPFFFPLQSLTVNKRLSMKTKEMVSYNTYI